MKTKAVVSIVASKMPMTILAIVLPDIFWFFEFLDGEKIELGCEFGLELFAGIGWPRASWKSKLIAADF